MSYKPNTTEQISLLDSFSSLPQKSQNMIVKSWPGAFATIVFPNINEDRFSVLYSSRRSTRPNMPVNIIVGGLILKEYMGLTDAELSDCLRFDIRYQYALHTTNLSSSPLSPTLLKRFKARLSRYRSETGEDLLETEKEALKPHLMRFARHLPVSKRRK